jgi:Rad3-related DNA helicase
MLMSATILDYVQISRNIGLDINKVSYKALDSPFPKENRPIYLDYAGTITSKTLTEALPKLVEKTRNILNKYPNEKILIHCVSYKIRDYLIQYLDRTRTITHTSYNREEILEIYKASPKPLVLLSPSMDRGVDLPDDQCRVVIIAKVPYPDLGDPQISQRVHASKDGNSWYAHKAISKIIQMSGRAVRSKDDHADTYILDAKFDDLLRDNRHLFPMWWRQSIIR